MAFSVNIIKSQLKSQISFQWCKSHEVHVFEFVLVEYNKFEMKYEMIESLTTYAYKVWYAFFFLCILISMCLSSWTAFNMN